MNGLTRRFALSGLIVAPAIVRVASIMPVKSFLDEGDLRDMIFPIREPDPAWEGLLAHFEERLSLLRVQRFTWSSRYAAISDQLTRG